MWRSLSCGAGRESRRSFEATFLLHGWPNLGQVSIQALRSIAHTRSYECRFVIAATSDRQSVFLMTPSTAGTKIEPATKDFFGCIDSTG